MRLTDFILEHMELILAEWETFAASLLPAAGGMTPHALRDHGPHILEAVAKDLTTHQSAAEQANKSKGQAPTAEGAPETAAQTHAVLRARVGFDINQLVAEYRALRASVIRHWYEANPHEELDVQDLIRFNEAIDQAIAESVAHFHAQTTQSRNLLLGMLGHDMRTPLHSIVATASYLAALNAGEDVSLAADRLIRSGASMQNLLNDLIDFNRTQLGLSVKIDRTDIDLGAELTEEVKQLRVAHPDRPIEFDAAGDLRGRWDGPRLQQVLRNLVENAIDHGSSQAPVRVTLVGEETKVRLEVTNSGSAIETSLQATMFDPLERGLRDAGGHSAESLGLGLFVVREIMNAHGGDVEVHSDERETTFGVRLPRRKRDESA